MFTGLTLFVFCSFSVNEFIDLNAIEDLQQRGFSTSAEDIDRALEKLFTDKDQKLYITISSCLHDWDYNKHADKILALYTAIKDEEFKKQILPWVAKDLSSAKRIARSKYGCQFYDMAVNMLCGGPYTMKMAPEGWLGALTCIVNLSKNMDFDVSNVIVKSLLTIPVNGYYHVNWLLSDLEKRGIVTEEAAYFIFVRYRNNGYERYLKTYEILAEPYLSGGKRHKNLSIDTYIRQLDIHIEGCGKSIHAEYKNLDPETYVEEGEPEYGEINVLNIL